MVIQKALSYFRLLSIHLNSLTDLTYALTESSDIPLKGEGGLVNREHPLVVKVEENLRDALLVSSDSRLQGLLGMFYSDIGEYSKAEDFLIRAIEMDHRNVWAVMRYVNLLDQIGHAEIANSFLSGLLLPRKVIHPLTTLEETLTLKVFSVNGSYKSLSISSTHSANDICLLMCKALRVPFVFGSCDVSLLVGSTGQHDLARRDWLDSAKVVDSFYPWEYPWCHVQRIRGGTFALQLKKSTLLEDVRGPFPFMGGRLSIFFFV